MNAFWVARQSCGGLAWQQTAAPSSLADSSVIKLAGQVRQQLNIDDMPVLTVCQDGSVDASKCSFHNARYTGSVDLICRAGLTENIVKGKCMVIVELLLPCRFL